MTQLVERSLLTPEVSGLNPVIGILLYGTFVYSQMYWKDENKEEVAGMALLKKHVDRRGHGAGQVVSELAFSSADPSSNPADTES